MTYPYNIAFRLAGLLVLGVLLVGTSCKKKNRLSASNFGFRIDPAAVKLVKGNTVTLKADAQSASGPIQANASWTVSSSAGDLNTSVGPEVILTVNDFGDITVTATFDGLTATSEIASVAFISGSNTFDVIVDPTSPCSSSGSSSNDIFLSGGLVFGPLCTGYTPDGIEYLRTTSATTGAFWGFDLTVSSSLTDLSAFSSGNLKFAIRTGRVVGATEVININIEDSGTTVTVVLSSTVGFNRLLTDWQEITIPISSYGGLDLTKIKVPFAIALASVSSALTFDIDAVRWEK